MRMRRIFTSVPNSSAKSFTLIELIIVIIIVGILAAVGISQYALTVEKSRLAEAKVRIGAMRKLAYEYYLNNGSLTGIQNSDLGADNTCTTTNFYRFTGAFSSSTRMCLAAHRCTGGGKSPDAARQYVFYMVFYPGTDQSFWSCFYSDDSSSCFGLPADKAGCW